MLDGAYPEDLLADTAPVTDWSFVQDGDTATAAVPLSVLGINYYSTSKARRYAGVRERLRADGHGDSDASPWVGADWVEFVPVPGPYTAMGWNIDPSGMSELLTTIGSRYPGLPLMVTENGAAFYDEVSPDGRVHDADRISYLHGHIDAVGAAREAGHRRAGVLPLVPAGQLRVGLRIRPPVRHHPRRLRHPRADGEGLGALVRRADQDRGAARHPRLTLSAGVVTHLSHGVPPR